MPYIVKNYGPHGASPSKLSIGFPTWMTPTVPANCTRTGQTLDCDIPALNVDELVQVTVPYAISAAGGNGTLTASLTGHETELITGNNTYSQAVTASERADLGALVHARHRLDRSHRQCHRCGQGHQRRPQPVDGHDPHAADSRRAIVDRAHAVDRQLQPERTDDYLFARLAGRGRQCIGQPAFAGNRCRHSGS